MFDAARFDLIFGSNKWRKVAEDEEHEEKNNDDDDDKDKRKISLSVGTRLLMCDEMRTTN